MKINSFLKQQRWIKGPEFLWKSDTEWPEYPANVKEISNDDIEIKTAHSTTVEQKDMLERLENFSQCLAPCEESRLVVTTVKTKTRPDNHAD